MRTEMPAVIEPALVPEGFREVSREEYYKVVSPSPGFGRTVNQYEYYGRGYIHEWLNANHSQARVIAKSYSGDFPFTPQRYFLPTHS